MSIYPVRAKTWWAKKDMRDEKSFIKRLMDDGFIKCNRCNKIIKDWDKCYISHAFVYGFFDAYCNDKCLKGGDKDE